MKILGIETSCDETGVAIVEDGRMILSNIIASSDVLHNQTGGVIPEIAAREQVRYIIPVLKEALYKSHTTLSEIEAIAVTVGPGLIGSLLVGVETAKTFAVVSHIPIIPVNHIFAHIYANFLNVDREPKLPAIALVVSGGHTELFYMDSNHQLTWIGGTLDDAAGEAFDKTARLMELGGYPGGPAIAAAAAKFKIENSKLKIMLPRPMMNSKDLNFSFSGLKAAVIREVNKLKTANQFNNGTIHQLAYEIQESITDVLVKKTFEALNQHQVKSILLGGGVAANKRLTEKMQQKIKSLKSDIGLHIPPPKLCTDSAAYIASYAYFHNQPKPWKNIQAQPDLEVEV